MKYIKRFFQSLLLYFVGLLLNFPLGGVLLNIYIVNPLPELEALLVMIGVFFSFTMFYLPFNLNRLAREIENLVIGNTTKLLYFFALLELFSLFYSDSLSSVYVWSTILFTLVLGVELYWLGIEFYKNEIKIIGAIIATLSLFMYPPIISAFISILGIYLYIGFSDTGSDFDLEVEELDSFLKDEIVRICSEKGVIDVDEIGSKTRITKNKLIKLITKFLESRDCKHYVIAGRVVCECSGSS